jgi:hypothetical protein
LISSSISNTRVRVRVDFALDFTPLIKPSISHP